MRVASPTKSHQTETETQCIIRGKTHKPDFEIGITSQRPLLSGETCKILSLMCFTIPKKLNKVEHCTKNVLTKKRLLSTYEDVFTSPTDSLPSDIYLCSALP